MFYNRIYHFDPQGIGDLSTNMPVAVRLCRSYVYCIKHEQWIGAIQAHYRADNPTKCLILSPDQYRCTEPGVAQMNIYSYPRDIEEHILKDSARLRAILIHFWRNGQFDINVQKPYGISFYEYYKNANFGCLLHEMKIDSPRKFYRGCLESFCTLGLWTFSQLEWLIEHDNHEQARKAYRPLWNAFVKRQEGILQEFQMDNFSNEQNTSIMYLFYQDYACSLTEEDRREYGPILHQLRPQLVALWNDIYSTYRETFWDKDNPQHPSIWMDERNPLRVIKTTTF